MARKVPRPQYHRDGPSLGQDQDKKGLTNHPGPLLNLSFFACSSSSSSSPSSSSQRSLETL